MATIKELYLQSLLAQAAYADLAIGHIGDAGITALRDNDKNMSLAQARDFAAKYTVIDQYKDASGVSATVFQEIVTNTKYLAIRGTTPTDFGDLNADYILFTGIPSFINPQYIQLSMAINGWLSGGVLPSNFTVTGHSLGGYLALAVGSAFHANTSHVYTYNAPGLGGITGNAIDALRVTLGLSSTALVSDISNVRGTAGISLITGLGLQLAPPLMIETELTANPLGVFDNHSIVNVTDSLAVQNILAMLDPTVSTVTLNDIMKSSGRVKQEEQENTLDAIRKFFGLTDITPVGNHDMFWTNLVNLQNSPVFKDLMPAPPDFIGKVTITAPPTSATEAHADFGAFLSLVYLTPFALKPNDISATVLLKTSSVTNSQLALEWEQDNTHTPGQTPNYSDMWLADRAHLLTQLIHRNSVDSVMAVGGGVNETYQDMATGQIFSTTDVGYIGPGLPPDSKHIIFGDDNANIDILGGSQTDHLYGGGGDDIVIGNKGNDYLEGGLGSDIYIYASGDGFDTLLDSDGLGKIQWDSKEIKGANTAGLASSQWKQLSNTAWRDETNHITYSLKTQADGSQTLFINKIGDELRIDHWMAGNLGITLGAGAPSPASNLLNGDQRAFLIGIETDFNIPPNDASYNTYKWLATHYAADGTLLGGVAAANFNDVIYGGNADETINGLTGNDALDGGVGNDTLDGGVGDDLIGGGAGSDIIYGGAGNDEILSATGLSAAQRQGPGDVWQVPAGQTLLIQGSTWGIADNGKGTYTIYGGGSLVSDTAADIIFAGDGNDKVTGGLGDDYIDGGLNNDTLWGHGGNDIIDGGDGDDVLQGDGLESPGLYQTLALANQGNDFLDGGAGSDTLVGGGKNDVLLGGIGNDFLWGDTDIVTTQNGQDHGNDFMDGGEGDDQLIGRGKDDMLIGGAGNDLLFGDDAWIDDLAAQYLGNDTLDGGDGNDGLDGEGGNDILLGGAGIDLLLGGDGNDYLEGGDGDDLSSASGNALGNGGLVGGDGDDSIYGGAGMDEIAGGEGNDFLDGGTGDDLLFGQAGDDTSLGGEGNDKFSGGDGNDALDGGVGNDLILGDTGDDKLTGGDGVDQLQGGDGNDILQGGSGVDILFGQTGNDTLNGGEGSDYLEGGAGDDTYLDVTSLDTIYDNEGNNYIVINGAGGLAAIQALTLLGSKNLAVKLDSGDTVNFQNIFFGSSFNLQFGNGTQLDLETQIGNTLTTAINLQLGNTGGRLFGGAAGDTLTGGLGNDSLSGALGNDYLIGKDGNDQLEGGAGNDTLGGENGNDALTGGVGNDYIYGGAGNDIVNGGAGNDRLDGGIGSDTYLFEQGWGQDEINNYDINTAKTDVIQFAGGISLADIKANRAGDTLILSLIGTPDTLWVSNYFKNDGLGAYQVEEIRFADGTVWDVATVKDKVNIGSDSDDYMEGGTTDDTLNGLGGNDHIYAMAGNDLLVGGTGNDTLEGGEGSDVYLFEQGWGQDVVNNADSNTIIGKTDAIQFAAGISPTDIQASPDRDAYMSVSSDALILTRIGSTDTLRIENYFDYFYSGGSVEEVRFADGTVWDVAMIKAMVTQSSNADDFLYGFFSDDTLNGFGGNDKLHGGNGNDVLNGGIGNDYLAGGKGSDIYLFEQGWGQDMVNNYDDSIGMTDTIKFSAGILVTDIQVSRSGDDLVLSRIGSSDTLKVQRYFNSDEAEQIKVEEIRFADGTVWDEATIRAMANNEGSNGADIMVGSAAADTINGLGGNDSLLGLGGNDTLLGGDGDDLLDGGSGFDAMQGGAGDDTYVVDNPMDVVTEGLNEGVDWVQSLVTYTLAANAENLTLMGSEAINGAGNTLENILTGNSAFNTLIGDAGNDYLDGGVGADNMLGGTGNDTYIVDISADVITENANEGEDTVESSVTLTLFANIENLTLTGIAAINGIGNALNNVLAGNSAANKLSGGKGVDTMIGRAGNDIYVVDNILDVVNENFNEGTDLVKSRATYTLAVNVENLILIGTNAINGTGNELDNLLTGNRAINTLIGGAGNDQLNGKGGADIMLGGIGDDTYVVNASTDVVTENVNEGTDSVETGVSYFLGTNVENLLLTGIKTINGTGNSLNNVLIGNNAVNTLTGGAGNDRLDGKAGADKMLGGTGDDIYIVDVSTDAITEKTNEGNDTVETVISYNLGANLENLTLTGLSKINGTGNALNNMLIGNDADNILNGRLGNDLLTGGGGIDHFQFTTALGANNVDTITDFVSGIDKIELSKTIFTAFGGLTVGSSLSNTEIGNCILYDINTGFLSYDADGSLGDGAAVKIALVGIENHPDELQGFDFKIAA